MSKCDAYGLAPELEHRPPPRVLGGGGHVVGHDVEHQPQARAVRRLDEDVEGLGPSQLVAQSVRVDDVITVGAARHRLEAGRQVEMAHAEIAQIGHERGRVPKTELGPQL